MAISNAQKRRLTCQFCTKYKPGCSCKKYWKEIYNSHRDEILHIYHDEKENNS